MKKKLFAVILLFSAITVFCACNNEATPEQTVGYEETTETTDIETTAAPADPFLKVRDSGEEWLKYGLSAFESGKEPTDLKEFFSKNANLGYLTLYDHMFTFDKERSIGIAEALFYYIYNEYGVEALLDISKRTEYKTEYLKSLGLESQYPQHKEVETFLSSMDFSSNKTYKYIFSFDNITYYFKDFGSGSPAQYHGFLYYSTLGLREMAEYINENDKSGLFDTEREFNFYMTFDGSGYSRTVYSTGDMYINDSYSTLHEAVHSMGIKTNANIWISEGICNYFGKGLGFNDQIAALHCQLFTMAKQGYFDERAKAGDEEAIACKREYEEYTERGGRSDSFDKFDMRLYYDVSATIELETGKYKTIGDAYEVVNKKECNSVGKELSYSQTTSLTMYIVDNYGLEKLLQAYETQDVIDPFGKSYEALKAEWLEYLNTFKP